MRKLILTLFFGCVSIFAIDNFIDGEQELILFGKKLSKHPLEASARSVEFGGSKSFTEAEKDGVGVVILGDGINSEETNTILSKYADDAAKANQTVWEYIQTNPSVDPNDKTKAEELLNNAYADPNIAKLKETTLLGSTVVRCSGIPVGAVVKGYKVVDNALLRSELSKGTDPSKLCTTNVTDMTRLFYGNSTFNKPLTGWDFSNVRSTREMFANSRAFNQPVTIFSEVLNDATGMFRSARAFNNRVNMFSNATGIDISYLMDRAYNNNYNANVSIRSYTLDPNDFRLLTTAAAVISKADNAFSNTKISYVPSPSSLNYASSLVGTFSNNPAFNDSRSTLRYLSFRNAVNISGMFANTPAFRAWSGGRVNFSRVIHADYFFYNSGIQYIQMLYFPSVLTLNYAFANTNLMYANLISAGGTPNHVGIFSGSPVNPNDIAANLR